MPCHSCDGGVYYDNEYWHSINSYPFGSRDRCEFCRSSHVPFLASSDTYKRLPNLLTCLHRWASEPAKPWRKHDHPRQNPYCIVFAQAAWLQFPIRRQWNYDSIPLLPTSFCSTGLCSRNYMARSRLFFTCKPWIIWTYIPWFFWWCSYTLRGDLA